MNISLNIQGRPQELVSVLTALSGLAESQSDSIQVPIAMPAETAKPVAKSLPKQTKTVAAKEEVAEEAPQAEQPTPEPVEAAPVETPVPQPVAAQPGERLTVEAVRKLVQAKAAEGKTPGIKTALATVGAGSVSEVAESRRAEFHALISAL